MAMLAMMDIIICGFTVDATALKQLDYLTKAKAAALEIQEAMNEVTYVLQRAKQLTEVVGVRDQSVDAA